MKHLLSLNRHFWKYRGRFALGILFIALSNVFNVYAPVIVGEGVDFLTSALQAKPVMDNGESASVDYPGTLSVIRGALGLSSAPLVLRSENAAETIVQISLLLALAYFAFYLLKGIFLFFQRQTIIVMSRLIEYDQKNEIYRHYQALDTSFYRRNRTGDLMNRISEDVSRVRMYLGPAVMYTINLAVLVIMCAAVMWNIDAELTLYTLSPLPFMGIAIFYVSSVINRRTERVQSQQSRLSSMVQETVSGIRLVRAFHRETHFTSAFGSASAEYRRDQLRLVRADALFMPVISILVGLSTILTLAVGAGKVMDGEITYGVIVQFVFYVNLLTWPFASVGWVTSLVRKAEASQERINEFLQTRPAIVSPERPHTPGEGDIRFEDVHFTYPETGIQALKGVTFTVRTGEHLAIVGRTGSGKSTIAQLLMRMYDPQHGRISVAQRDLRELDLPAWRNRIGYVPQDVFLFSDTIARNIRFGTDSLDEEEMRQCARDASIHEAICTFPKGYDTLLGERGINLSGGQKQRISIARALARNARIYIFDDCLSAVDTATEDHILRALKTRTRDRTVLSIAHRLSTVREADRIIVLEKGQIAEEGTHIELLRNNGLYAAMYRRQQASREGGST